MASEDKGNRRELKSQSVATVDVGGEAIPILFARHPRARRYILRLTAAGMVRLTIPRGGNRTEGLEFAQRHRAWLERRRGMINRGVEDLKLSFGDQILLRGRSTDVQGDFSDVGVNVRVGELRFRLGSANPDLRIGLEKQLRKLAKIELTNRTFELADRHGFRPSRVGIRAQRSRWGSCSSRGTISLNWRLIQAPEWVADYVILHELAHLRHTNHSGRFWRLLGEICPDTKRAESWLKANSGLITG